MKYLNKILATVWKSLAVRRQTLAPTTSYVIKTLVAMAIISKHCSFWDWISAKMHLPLLWNKMKENIWIKAQKLTCTHGRTHTSTWYNCTYFHSSPLLKNILFEFKAIGMHVWHFLYRIIHVVWSNVAITTLLLLCLHHHHLLTSLKLLKTSVVFGFFLQPNNFFVFCPNASAWSHWPVFVRRYKWRFF